MIKIISVAFVLVLASASAQAMPLAPIQQPDSMITQVVAGCGAGRTRVDGVCVASNHQTPRPQVCTMEWKHLRTLLLTGRAITARDLNHDRRVVALVQHLKGRAK